jgi:hypothetical protein
LEKDSARWTPLAEYSVFRSLTKGIRWATLVFKFYATAFPGGGFEMERLMKNSAMSPASLAQRGQMEEGYIFVIC